MASFWDDITDFGSSLLDDVGEGMGNLIDGYTQPSDVAANPATHSQNPTYSDRYGNAITQPQGAVVQKQAGIGGFTNRQLFIGGGFALAIALILKK